MIDGTYRFNSRQCGDTLQHLSIERDTLLRLGLFGTGD